MRPSIQNGSTGNTFYPAVLGNSDNLKIGQSMVAISGRDSNAASIGRVFQLFLSEDKSSVIEIQSDLKVSRAHLGSPALNLSGEIIGIEIPPTEGETEYSYLPINIVKSSTSKALEEMSK
jgi:S1-C subfamily serine protease